MLNYPIYRMSSSSLFFIKCDLQLNLNFYFLLKNIILYIKLEYSTGNLTFSTGKIIHEIKIDSTGKIVILYMTVKQQPNNIIQVPFTLVYLKNNWKK
jgi:hypothetical protein